MGMIMRPVVFERIVDRAIGKLVADVIVARGQMRHLKAGHCLVCSHQIGIYVFFVRRNGRLHVILSARHKSHGKNKDEHSIFLHPRVLLLGIDNSDSLYTKLGASIGAGIGIDECVARD